MRDAESAVAAPAPTRSVGALTAAASLGIASPGYIHHGLAAIGPFLLAAFALSKSSYGLFLSGFSFVGAITSPTLGKLADRVGGVRLLRWAFLLGIGVSVGIALSPNVYALFAGAMIAGLTASAANPSTNRLISTYVPARWAGITVGIKQAGGPLGIALAGAATPPIAARFGWRWAVLTGLALPAAGLLLLWWSGAEPTKMRPARDRSAARQRLGRRMHILTVNAIAVGLGLGAVLGFLAVYGVEEVGLSETAAGAMLSVIGVVGVVARLGWGVLADRIEGSRALLSAIGGIAMVASVGIWAAGNVGPWLLIASTVLMGSSAMAWNGIGMLAVIRESSAERAGAASGVVVFGFLAGFTAGPLAFGALVDLTNGYTASFAMVAAAFVLSVAVLAIRPEGKM